MKIMVVHTYISGRPENSSGLVKKQDGVKNGAMTVEVVRFHFTVVIFLYLTSSEQGFREKR